ncbi:CLUMA_CG021633, isoform A [Clunio marinus]|uniref:CLUMA_CG021633, isoform A n=1 Tax=Clunio marinus TaxID=568069 RepID=A0A1J1J8M6_9DIPT|nr:CLUMA_CG021633, isoform A [Clunio marinus]
MTQNSFHFFIHKMWKRISISNGIAEINYQNFLPFTCENFEENMTFEDSIPINDDDDDIIGQSSDKTIMDMPCEN